MTTSSDSRSIDLPAALLAKATKFGEATDPDRASSMNQWVARHNEIVMRFFRNGTTDATMTPGERAILALASGIRDYVAISESLSVDGSSMDYLAFRDVVRPMLSAFVNALNWDLGRLDGGTLDSWARRLFTDVTGNETADEL